MSRFSVMHSMIASCAASHQRGLDLFSLWRSSDLNKSYFVCHLTHKIKMKIKISNDMNCAANDTTSVYVGETDDVILQYYVTLITMYVRQRCTGIQGQYITIIWLRLWSAKTQNLTIYLEVDNVLVTLQIWVSHIVTDKDKVLLNPWSIDPFNIVGLCPSLMNVFCFQVCFSPTETYLNRIYLSSRGGECI